MNSSSVTNASANEIVEVVDSFGVGNCERKLVMFSLVLVIACLNAVFALNMSERLFICFL